MVEETSKWWWIGSHNTSDLSPWLQSTLSGLDAKTKAMLRMIEEEADSFAERAEMYYKKRPELIAMVEDLYRTYRSLAERYDLARPSSAHRHAPPEKSIHASDGTQEKSTYDEDDEESRVIYVPETHEKSTYDEESWTLHVSETPEKSIHVLETLQKSTYNEESWITHDPETPDKSNYRHESWSYASEIEEYAESEVYDGEDENGGDGESTVDDAVTDDEGEGFVESVVDDAEAAAKMKEEVEKLREENRVCNEQLRQKDEEKREAIRQLSMAVEMLKEENLELKKCVAAAAKQKELSPKKQLWSPFEFKKLKEGFLGRSWQLGSRVPT